MKFRIMIICVLLCICTCIVYGRRNRISPASKYAPYSPYERRSIVGEDGIYAPKNWSSRRNVSVRGQDDVQNKQLKKHHKAFQIVFAKYQRLEQRVKYLESITIKPLPIPPVPLRFD